MLKKPYITQSMVHSTSHKSIPTETCLHIWTMSHVLFCIIVSLNDKFWTSSSSWLFKIVACYPKMEWCLLRYFSCLLYLLNNESFKPDFQTSSIYEIAVLYLDPRHLQCKNVWLCYEIWEHTNKNKVYSGPFT